MPVETKLYEKEGIRLHKGTGKITIKDFEEALKEGMKYKGDATRLHALWEMRQAEFLFDANEVEAMVAKVKKPKTDSSPSYKIAYVVSKHIEFALIKMYQSIAKRDPLFNQVFRDMSEALKWLDALDLVGRL